MAAMLWRHVVIKTDNDPGLFSYPVKRERNNCFIKSLQNVEN